MVKLSELVVFFFLVLLPFGIIGVHIDVAVRIINGVGLGGGAVELSP